MPAPPEPSWLEIVNPDYPRGPFRCAVFDFDGTLSLLRGNWQGLMVPMMVEALLATGSGESRESLTAIVEEFVTRLTGQPTIQQMRALADEVVKRGRPRPDPSHYLARYLDQLISRTEARIDAVRIGKSQIGDFLVPGALTLVERLHAAGWILAIASGTELPHVVREAGVLKIDQFFGTRIFGPANSNAPFSKERILRQLMAEHSLAGQEIVAIGDGPAEILAAKAVGGLALGVASDEVSMSGRVNGLKRDHLIRSGADVIIPDYANLSTVLTLIQDGETER
jgi:phosphoglycolate phosphatase-like HAD superfamily hydrolase